MSSGDTLGAMFEASCQRHAAITAVATAAGSIDYAELLARAQGFSAALVAGGLTRGDRVAVWLPNGVDWVVAHWGITLAGGVVVPIGTRSRPPEIHHVLGQCQASTLVMVDGFLQADHLAMLGAVRARGLPALETVVVRRRPAATAALPDGAREWGVFLAGGSGAPPADGSARAAGIEPGDLHLIQYTAGTTGVPRGAMLSHAGLLMVASSHAASWGLRPGDAIFIPNPLSHIMGAVMAVIMPVIAGATMVTAPTFAAAEAMTLIARHRCVAMAGTPTHYLALSAAAELEHHDISSLRFGMCGGAAVTAQTIRAVVDKLALDGLMVGLGMSEASGSVTRTSLDDPPEVAAASIGRAMQWLDVKIVDPVTGAEVGEGAPGELWIRGPGIMKGYFAAPEATDEVLTPEGWLRTGDLVRVRGDGALELVGRHKEMFTVGGFNVYPGEVERALSEHPAVGESCVVGVPDPRLGEVPFAFVRAPGDRAADPAAAAALGGEIIAFCRDRLASYKVPRFIAVVSELPVLGAGKIDRRALRDRAAREARELPGYLFRS